MIFKRIFLCLCMLFATTFGIFLASFCCDQFPTKFYKHGFREQIVERSNFEMTYLYSICIMGILIAVIIVYAILMLVRKEWNER